jgi:hypothetical protein
VTTPSGESESRRSESEPESAPDRRWVEFETVTKDGLPEPPPNRSWVTFGSEEEEEEEEEEE